MKTTQLLILLILVPALIFAGTDRIQILRGTQTLTLDAADSTGFNNAFSPIQISDMLNGATSFKNKTWDRIVGSVIVPAFTPLDADSVDGENEVDTAIIRYNFITEWYTLTVEVDTSTLPCTTQFVIDADVWADAAATTNVSASGDSAYAYVLPTLTSDFSAFLMDQFTIEVYASDTAGTNGTSQGAMSTTARWWFKFFEDK